MILIVSHADDEHAIGVLRALERSQHPVALLDTAKFPASASLTQRFENDRQQLEFCADGQRIDLNCCRAGWWRRPQPYTLHDGLDSEVAAFTYAECHEAISGLWSALDLRWINPLERDETAHHKPYQLAMAAKIGLPIPRTVITNDPDTARRFIAECGAAPTIYKTFLASEQCWRETRVVKPEELTMLDSVRLAPVIFQEYIPAAADLRVTVVGEQIFAAAICVAPEGYSVDYRMDMNGAHFAPTQLSDETQEKLLAFMRVLGLVYGAVDFRRTIDGREVFLEVNPAGEWLFVEERTEQPITEAMAALLVQFDQE